MVGAEGEVLRSNALRFYRGVTARLPLTINLEEHLLFEFGVSSVKNKTDYIPNSDADFHTWLHNFQNYATANLAPLGLTTADQTALQNVITAWEAAYNAHAAAQAAAQSARQAKDDSRDEAEAVLRPMSGQLQARTEVTDAQRLALGLPVRSTTRRASSTPTTRPVAQIDTSQRLRHTISWTDELTPTTRARPDGVSGCEIFSKVGEPAPVDPEELKYLALDTATPYIVFFDGSDAGKIAYYMLRWVSTRGERGPWSHTVSATITN